MTPTDITPPGKMLYITINDRRAGPWKTEALAAEVAQSGSADGTEILQHNEDLTHARLWVHGEIMLEGSANSIMQELGR